MTKGILSLDFIKQNNSRTEDSQMKRFLAIIVMLVLASSAFAQTDAHNVTVTLGAFGLIRLSDGSNITITIDQNDVATEGAQPSAETDATQYLQYTICAAADQEITAGLDSDMPVGVTLAAVAVVGGAAGAGDRGTADAGGNLSSTAIDIVSSIGTCYTGTGATDGANVTYTATTDGTVAPASIVRTVTYTIKADD